MGKFKLIAFAVTALLFYSVSCDVLINATTKLSVNVDSVDYGIVPLTKTSSVTIELKNDGKNEIILTAAKIEYLEDNLKNGLQITAGKISSKIELQKDYKHDLDLTFEPTVEGLVNAELIIEYTSNSKNKEIRIPVTGEGAEAKISIVPQYYDFKHSYLNKPKTKTFSIRNIVSKPITIEMVSLVEYGSNTSNDELYISAGWNDSPTTLQFADILNVDVTFNPKSITDKHAALKVVVENSVLDYEVVINGWGAEILKIITPTTLPEGVKGSSYNAQIEASGGDGKYRFVVVDGALPGGIHLLTNGELVGKSNDYGDFSIAIEVRDGSGNTAVRTFVMRVTYASLIRDPYDDDPAYIFSKNDDEGLYIVNLINAGVDTLTITKITLSGTGEASGEATILDQPTLPAVLSPSDTTRIVIRVESLLDTGKDVKLTVDHTGFNSPYVGNFRWGVEGVQHIFIIDASGSMNTQHNVSYPVYNQDGNVILDPTRWEIAVYDISTVLRSIPETDKFEVIAFDDQLHYFFGKMEYANGSNRYDSIAWLFNFKFGGCSNMYDGMYNGFKNYGVIQDMYVYSDGGANTALLLGCAGCACGGWIGSRIYTDCQVWVPDMVSQNSGFQLYMLQYAASPTSFMQQVGSLPNCNYTLK